MKSVSCPTGEKRADKFVVSHCWLRYLTAADKQSRDGFLRFPMTISSVRRLTVADIVHLYLPYKLCMRTREIAEEMGHPVYRRVPLPAWKCYFITSVWRHLTFLPHILLSVVQAQVFTGMSVIYTARRILSRGQLSLHNYKADLHGHHQRLWWNLPSKRLGKNRNGLKGKIQYPDGGAPVGGKNGRTWLSKPRSNPNTAIKSSWFFLGKGPKQKVLWAHW